jgi:hypothetical protein
MLTLKYHSYFVLKSQNEALLQQLDLGGTSHLIVEVAVGEQLY